MKTKTNGFLVCLLCFSICSALNSKAQQAQSTAKPNNAATMAMQKSTASNYTYRVFQAPNKMFGYDIFQNGKGIFHQPASIVSPNNPALAGKENPQNAAAFNQKQTPQNLMLSKKKAAENAALLSIEKIKKQMPPTLTSEEIKKIVSQ